MTRYVRNGEVEAAPMLEETILFSPAAKRFCVLNPTAAALWEGLAQPATFEQLTERLRQRFETEGTADVEGDVRAVLQQFGELNMISRVES